MHAKHYKSLHIHKNDISEFPNYLFTYLVIIAVLKWMALNTIVFHLL